MRAGHALPHTEKQSSRSVRPAAGGGGREGPRCPGRPASRPWSLAAEHSHSAALVPPLPGKRCGGASAGNATPENEAHFGSAGGSLPALTCLCCAPRAEGRPVPALCAVQCAVAAAGRSGAGRAIFVRRLPVGVAAARAAAVDDVVMSGTPASFEVLLALRGQTRDAMRRPGAWSFLLIGFLHCITSSRSRALAESAELAGTSAPTVVSSRSGLCRGTAQARRLTIPGMGHHSQPNECENTLERR